MKANNLADSIHFFRLRGYREPLIDTRHIASDIPQGRFPADRLRRARVSPCTQSVGILGR